MRLQRMIADRRRIARPLPYPSISGQRASRPGARACRLPSQEGRQAAYRFMARCRSAEDPDHENRLRRGVAEPDLVETRRRSGQ